MSNMDASPPPPAAERPAAGQRLADEPLDAAPRGQVINLDEARRRRLGVGRRTWRPKGW